MMNLVSAHVIAADRHRQLVAEAEQHRLARARRELLASLSAPPKKKSRVRRVATRLAWRWA